MEAGSRGIRAFFRSPARALDWAAAGVVPVDRPHGASGLALTVLVVTRAPQRLRDVDRVHVEDETIPAESPPLAEPA
jgi:hypothetical protein